jgi:diguanylate cyclase (GGDEF)-like protein
MATASEASRPGFPLSGALAVRHWAVWQLPARTLYPVLLVELTTVLLACLLLSRQPPPMFAEVGTAALLAFAGIAHAEIALGVERVRRRIGQGNIVDLSSIWTFAAALVLPAFDAGLVAVFIYGYFWCRAWRLRTPLYRQLFSMSTVALACFASSTVLHFMIDGESLSQVGTPVVVAGVILALLVYTAVNTCLVAGAIALSSTDPSLTTLFASWDENLLEIATLCLGALTAAALLINPWLVLLVLPPLIVLHRAALVRQLQEAASTDSKTGLLNAAAWQDRAHRVLQRAQRNQGGAAVLILDLDHFKLVNDRHGHLAGDRVLMSVAEALRAEVRDNDLVGRFGGEEFVIMLPGHDGAGYDRVELEAVADRIRRRVDALGVEVATADGALTVGDLSVSVGGASFPDDAADLDGLLEVADSALYAAKRSGRNAVRMGLHVHATQQLPQPWADGDGSCASPVQRPLGESAEPAPRPSPHH